MTSKLDDVLTGYVAASKDAQREGMIDREDVAEVVDAVKAARAELAQLRRAPSEAVGLLRDWLTFTNTKYNTWDEAASAHADLENKIRRFLAAQEP